MPNYLNRVVYLSEAQKEQLFSTGTTSGQGQVITYDANDLYVTPLTSGGGGGGGGGTTYTSFSGNPSTDQTPAFGGTFTISQIFQTSTGQVGGTDRTITIPDTLVSSTSSGLAPKGAAVSTQSQSTKFLREDGSWAVPSYSTGGTDEKVKQVEFSDSTSGSYPILFSNLISDSSEHTTYAGKQANLTYSPSTHNLVTGKFNGLTLTAATTGFTIAGGTTSKTLTVSADYTLAAACAKSVDSSISASSTSTNLPTSAAVATFVEGKGYKTTDANVAQTATTTNSAYEILFSGTADNTTRTEGAGKTSTLTYNPSSKAFVTGGTVDGYTLAGACAKSVDSSVSSSSTNLPTSSAVYSYVTGAIPSFTAITSAEIDAIVV